MSPAGRSSASFQRVSVSRGRAGRVHRASTRATARARTALGFLRSFPVSYPSYYDHSGAAGGAITDSSLHAGDRLLQPPRRTLHPPGPLPERGEAGTRRAPLRAGRLTLPELRIDPLSGHRTIVAGERSRRPGGEPGCAPPEPIDAEKDPFAEGHEDRTPPGAVRGAARRRGRRLSGLDGARRAEPVPGARPAERRGVERGRGRSPKRGRGRARSCSPRCPRRGAHEVIVNGPQSVLSLAELPRRAGRRGGRGVARADARARAERLPAADRQRASRGRRLAAAHPRPALRARLRARRGRARARACERLHDAHDGAEPAGRPGRRGGAPARAHRGDRRGGGADGAVSPRACPFS